MLGKIKIMLRIIKGVTLINQGSSITWENKIFDF